MTRQAHVVPPLLETLRQAGDWPACRLDTDKLSRYPGCRFLADLDLQLHASPDEGDEDVDVLMRRAETPFEDGAIDCKARRGSATTSPVELPFIDVEQVVCIGGGCDIGDDTWLLLDYRLDPSCPRVLANEHVHTTPDRWPDIYWREIAASFEEFCARIRSSDGQWVSAEPGPLSDFVLAQLAALNDAPRPTVSLLLGPPGIALESVVGSVLLCQGTEGVPIGSGARLPTAGLLKIAAGSALEFTHGGALFCRMNCDDERWIELRPHRRTMLWEMQSAQDTPTG